MVKFCVAALISIPLPNMDKVFPELMVTKPPGFVITTPKHETLPPKIVVFAPVTEDSHEASVVEVGTAQLQLPATFKLVLLFNFTLVAVTVIVPVAFTLPQAPVNGML